MTTEQFQVAIEHGLGRAVLYLRGHSWKPHAEAIEHVCLHSTAYDPQCEGSRAAYVFEIVQLTGDLQHFSDITASGLLRTQDVDHLFDLALLFAKAGCAQAREAMYERFRGSVTEQRAFVGGERIISLDGVSGLLFVAEHIGQWMEANACPVDDYLIRQVGSESGIDTEKVLREAAGTNVNICRYMDAIDLDRQKPRAERVDSQGLSYVELRERIAASAGEMPIGVLMRWGRHAPEDELREAAGDLLEENDERRLIAYLRVFEDRPFPLDPARLVELARVGDRAIEHASRRALRHLADGSVRALALDLIASGQADGDVVKLLQRNYADGDHKLIESLLDGAENEDAYHWLATGALSVFQANPQADAFASMLRIYERSRCSIERNKAAEVLMQRQAIPSWMLEECHYDSYPPTREAARAYSEGDGGLATPIVR